MYFLNITMQWFFFSFLKIMFSNMHLDVSCPRGMMCCVIHCRKILEGRLSWNVTAFVILFPSFNSTVPTFDAIKLCAFDGLSLNRKNSVLVKVMVFYERSLV